MKLEVCANSFESARAAQQAGAHRIELCQELAIGGITPSHGLIAKVVEELDVPVFVLIRPRSGDFTYSESEFEVMLRNIAFVKEIGAHGIVSGVLENDNTIDLKRTAKLITAAKGVPFTFHRAFDWTSNASVALETLIALGVDRVLTSGQAPSAIEGFEVLKSLHKQAQGRIGILPGGGVSIENISRFNSEGFQEVHGSFSSFRESIDHPIKMYDTADLDANKLRHSDIHKIEEVLKELDRGNSSEGTSEVRDIR